MAYEEVKNQRFQFLHKLYEHSKGITSVRFTMTFIYSIATDLDLDNDTMRAIIDYLASEGLITNRHINEDTGIDLPDIEKFYRLGITHKGIKEIEQTKENPQTPTQHFPANIIYKIEGNYIERDRIVGDKFENISNATIINKSLVEGSFNKAKRKYGYEVSNALIQIAEFIQKSADPAAAVLFDNFNQELNKPQPDKPRLKNIWSGIETVFPSIETIAETVAKIGPLFKTN